MKITRFMKYPDSENGFSPDVAKKYLPDWYKQAESFVNIQGQRAKGLKGCAPFLDSMVSGYFLFTTTDIHISKNTDGKTEIRFNRDITHDPISERDSSVGRTIPRPAGMLDNHLAWRPAWGWKTPKGYSSLVTHPLNRFDLPFITLSGIIDSDRFYSAGNLPFFLKESFEGVIPKGTPYAQIIPIKRASWYAIDDTILEEKSVDHGNMSRLKNNFYKKFFWIKKEYSIRRSNEKQ